MISLRTTTVATALALSLFVLAPAEAQATSISTSSITSSNPVSDTGTTSSSVTQGNNVASSFVNPVGEKVGAFVSSDGTVFSLRTGSSHTDDWTCTGGCSAVLDPFGLDLAIGFDAVLSPNIGEFQLDATYTIGAGNDVFAISAGADSSPIFADASFDGDPIDVALVTDTSGNVHIVATMTRHFICPCMATNAPFFSDAIGIQIEMEGSGFIDASHTFSAAWTPTDPNLQFTSADGRTAGSGPSAAPVPSTPDPFPARSDAASDTAAATGEVAAAPAPPLPAAGRSRTESAAKVPRESDSVARQSSAAPAAGAPAAPLAKMAAAPDAASGVTDARQKDRKPLPVAEWIALIRRLRAEGKADEAARELTAFRAAHADHEKLLPPDLRDWRPPQK